MCGNFNQGVKKEILALTKLCLRNETFSLQRFRVIFNNYLVLIDRFDVQNTSKKHFLVQDDRFLIWVMLNQKKKTSS